MSIYFRKKKISPIIAVVSKEKELNLEYVKQLELFDAISGAGSVTGDPYTDIEMQNIEKILISLTEGKNGQI